MIFLPPLPQNNKVITVQDQRLDVLIYAHDGRGLGHASRSIGIGMALRRLAPELKVLFVSGCSLTQELIGKAPLDWLKLPSYATRIEQGKSIGIVGKSLFGDKQLAEFRATELAHLVSLYRPRVVLVDHLPQGKHKELIPALSISRGSDIRWILGVRGVVGAVPQAGSALAAQLFAEHYHGLLWYGDSRVLGTSHCAQLERQYQLVPVECGYVVRLAEFALGNEVAPPAGPPLAGTISIPWLGENTLGFLRVLASALKKIPASFGLWQLFIDTTSSLAVGREITRMFEPLDNCRIDPPGSTYVAALRHSKTAVIYGGYNSLMDVIHTGIPALVVLREMQDAEQQIHLRQLQRVAGKGLVTVLETQVTAEELETQLLGHLQQQAHPPYPFNTSGAANAAAYILSIV